MLCQSCGWDNRPDRKFCADCGARLSLDLKCGDCGTLNQPGERFCGECGQMLAGAVAAPPKERSEPAIPPSDSPPPTDEPVKTRSSVHPTSFVNGRYKVVRFLGEGGKKIVYLAHDTLLDRDVALALIKTAGLDAEGLARIRREVQAMGKLGDHPNIVTLYEIGEENGQPYLVSQLMRGGDVEGLIEKALEHKLPFEQAIRIADEVCRGLVHAHFHEIIHRDIKPGNVWLTPDGTAKVGDFGLAVDLGRSRLTQVGMMVGTVSYMPPEQALGGKPDKRSDLYSLGAMLYEMVTGKVPFESPEAISVITQHLNIPPVAPSWYRPDCPKALEILIIKLLEKDYTKRPASAAEVLEALSRIELSSTPPELDGSSIQSSDFPVRRDASGQLIPGPLYSRTFVGRETELRQVQSAFDDALSGQRTLLMVMGEPAVGKTSLCEQLSTYAAVRGGRALIGHCYEEESLSLPFLPFVEALRTYVLDRPPEALRDELGAGVAEIALIVPELRERLGLEKEASRGTEEARWRLLQAVADFLRKISNVKPLLLVIEDLQWADRGTLDMLTHLARNLEGSRLLIVGTYRDIEVDRAHPLSAALAEWRRIPRFQRILLGGLSLDGVQQLLTSLVGEGVPREIAAAIHQQTDGNPFFVQELLRYLSEQGLLGQGTRRRTVRIESLIRSIPEALRDVISKRLARLSPGCKQLLSVAAVIGREFRLDVWQQVSEASEDELFAALEEAKAGAAVEEQPTVSGITSFRFAQAFFRQILYEDLIAPRRARLHQQVAHVLEVQYSGRPSTESRAGPSTGPFENLRTALRTGGGWATSPLQEQHAAVLADHFIYSYDPDDLGKAVHYSKVAARQAAGLYAYSEAARLLEQALQAQEVAGHDDSAERCALLLALGDALLSAGEPRRVVEEIAPQALALAESLQEPELASRACRLALDGLWRYGAGTMFGTPEYSRWAERANRHAAPDTPDQVHADLALARVLWGRGQDEEAIALEERALDLARRLGDTSALCSVVCELLQGRWRPEDQEEQLRLAQDFGERDLEGVNVTIKGFLWTRCGKVFLAGGQREKAEQLWQRVDELAARTHDPDLLLLSLQNQAMLATLDGRLEAAIHLAARLTSIGDELGMSVVGRQYSAAVSFRHLLYLGRAEECLADLPYASQLAGLEEISMLTALGGLALAHLGRSVEAKEALGHVLVERNVASPSNKSPVFLLTLLLETGVLAEDREAVALLAARLSGIGNVATTDFVWTSPPRHLGAAAAILGEVDEARVYYQQALEMCVQIRFRPELALTRLQLAELLLQEASKLVASSKEEAEQIRVEALAHLDFAIDEFRQMKMQPFLERALSHKGILKA